jgi:hypothetical protein
MLLQLRQNYRLESTLQSSTEKLLVYYDYNSAGTVQYSVRDQTSETSVNQSTTKRMSPFLIVGLLVSSTTAGRSWGDIQAEYGSSG